MKRVNAACLSQTLHFKQKDELPREEAAALVAAEVANYKADLARKGVRYTLDAEIPREDGSVILRIRKQYLSAPVGDYLD